jgi:hypothetical protein
MTGHGAARKETLIVLVRRLLRARIDKVPHKIMTERMEQREAS